MAVFYGVGIHRRQLRARHAARHGELIGEHELHQLRQHTVLGAENVLERAVGNLGLFNDLRQRRPPVALFQKEPDADGQNSFFFAGRLALVMLIRITSFVFGVYHNSIA